MRLFDKCLTQGPQHMRHALSKIPSGFCVLEADEIAKHYAGNRQLLWGSEDYPYATPPWKMSFIEWHEPENIITENGPQKGNPSNQVGAIVTYSDAPNCVESAVRFLSSASTIGPFEVKQSCSRICMTMPCVAAQGTVTNWAVTTFWFMREDGWIENVCHTGSGLLPFIEKCGEDEAYRFFDSLLHVIALAFTFANCANVKLEDVTDELQPPPKIRRRLKIPEVKRYTLNIAGHVSRPSRDYNEGPKGVMPFHLCRGHFATYTAERPMFGNPKLVGRYWHPPHMKGKKEQGEIIKDYAIQG